MTLVTAHCHKKEGQPMLPQPQIDNLATQFLNGPLNGGAGADVRLFTNNVTPSASTVIGDLIEPTAKGYAPAGPHTDYYKTVDSDTGLTMLTQDNVANFHFTDGDDPHCLLRMVPGERRRGSRLRREVCEPPQRHDRGSDAWR